MTTTDPWAEFRRRQRPGRIVLVIWIASSAMFINEPLFRLWQWLAIPLLLTFVVLYFRTTFLECPRCGQPFYWPVKIVWRRCVHCGLKEYAPLEQISQGGA